MKGEENAPKWGDWLKEYWEKRCKISIKTAHRYMALSKKFDSHEALFRAGDGLREVYRQSGILKALAGAPKEGQGKGKKEPLSWAGALKKVNDLLAAVRDMSGLARRDSADGGSPLPSEHRIQVELAKAQIDKFFQSILTEKTNL